MALVMIVQLPTQDHNRPGIQDGHNLRYRTKHPRALAVVAPGHGPDLRAVLVSHPTNRLEWKRPSWRNGTRSPTYRFLVIFNGMRDIATYQIDGFSLSWGATLNCLLNYTFLFLEIPDIRCLARPEAAVEFWL